MINFDEMVDKFLQSEIRIRSIGRYYPSEAGQCMRKVWYSFRNPKPADKQLLKVFEAGNRLHEFVAEVFQSDKNPQIDLVEKEVPFLIEIDDFVISGRIDDLIRVKIENKEALVEVKSTKDLRYMEEPSESHVMQLQLYLHARKLREGILLYLEKNTLKSKTFHIVYDDNIFSIAISTEYLCSCGTSISSTDNSDLTSVYVFYSFSFQGAPRVKDLTIYYSNLSIVSIHSTGSHSSLSLRAHPSESKTGLTLRDSNVSIN